MTELVPVTFLDKVEVAFGNMKARIIAELGEPAHLHYAIQEAKESILTATAEHFPPMEDVKKEDTTKEEQMPPDATPGTEDPVV